MSAFPSGQGSDFGLTLVRELVELYGGTVRADSMGKEQGASATSACPAKTVTN